MSLSAQGNYEILRKIAAGGMAELFLARATGGLVGVERLVAIKQILPQHLSNAAFVQMFLDEARVAATLQHPNVVHMLEVGSDNGNYFIVMEYLHGENVRTLTKQLKGLGRPLGLEHTLGILIGAAAGLHYAHEKLAIDGTPLNIVHRDVSPHNILVTHEGAVKVVDFGIAKASNRANETKGGTLKGKIPYMSPEQCAGEALDRRSDVYALGALAYELSVGRRLVKAAPEYAMMKQIIEGDITPPSKLLPMYPPELEAIVMKSLARRRGQRYQTMQAFQADLEGLAREARLNTSAISLAAMMREAFGTTAPSLPTGLIDDEDEEPEATPPRADAKPRPIEVVSPPPPVIEPSSPAKAIHAGGKSAPTVERTSVGKVSVVTITGRLTEAFIGAEVGRQLSGDVVLDLSGIERVTSFGVREWLSMMHAAEPNLSSLYLARCTEPIVNQLTMIRGFVGPGRVLSFFAPYACTGCGEVFHRLIDAEADSDAIRRNDPPPASCPKCGCDGRFDDDPRSYFAIASQLATSVPQSIRAATGPVELTGRPSLEKHVDGGFTRVVVNGRLDGGLRWRRAMEGLEGKLVIDLNGVSQVLPEGVAPLVAALRKVAPDVETIELEACPLALVVPITQAALPNLRFASVVVERLCEPCGAQRKVRLERAEAEAFLADRLALVCPKCDAPLMVESATRSAIQAAMGRPSSAGRPVPAASMPTVPMSDLEVASEAPSPAPVVNQTSVPRSSPPLALYAAAGVAVVALGLAVVGAVGLYWLLNEPPAPADPVAMARVVEGPPAWAAQPVEVGDAEVFAVGRGGPSATPEEAVDAARSEAIGNLVGQLLLDVGAKRAVPPMPTEPSSRTAAIEHYTAAFSTTGIPERRDVSVHAVSGGQEAYVRYALPRASYAAIVDDLSATTRLGTFVVARPAPSEGGAGLVVVQTSDPEIPATARVVAVDGVPVSDLVGLPPAPSGHRVTIATSAGTRDVTLP